MTVAQIAALVGLAAVIVMAVVMAVEVARGRNFGQPTGRQPVAVESGSMPVSEVRNVAH